MVPLRKDVLKYGTPKPSQHQSQGQATLQGSLQFLKKLLRMIVLVVADVLEYSSRRRGSDGSSST